MQKNYNENLVAGAAIRDDKGRRISKLFESPHPKMTVGYAKNLIMPDTPTEHEFNFRQSGGGVIEDGVAVIDKVKGNSVVWNQIIAKPYTFGADRNFTFSTWYSGGSRSINDKGQFIFITNGETTGVGNALCMTPRNTHKYLLSYKVKADIASVCTIYKQQNSGVIANISEADKWYFVSCIVDNVDTANYSSGLNAIVAANSPETTVTIDDAQVIDLTQMFGAGNEPTTYEEFLSRKPKVADEYAYNEGTIVNNKVEKVVTTGRNLWDEEWEQGSINAQGLPVKTTESIRSKEFNRCLPNCEICFSCQSAAAKLIYWYDVNKAFISRYEIPNSASIYGVTTSPANAYFFKVRNDKSTYNHDICINLSDPTINGQYFPYEKHELDLSWVNNIRDAEGVKLFEDGMRSAVTAFDEVAKGKAIKRIGVYTFNGTEDWIINVYAQEKGITAYQCYSGLKPINENIRCDRFVTRPWSSSPLAHMAIFAIPKNGIIIETDGTQSLADFKASLEAKPLDVYYELAEPIEVEYDEKNLTYPVVAGGTEEAIASEPSSAFRADIGYGIDAVKTILDLKARVKALEEK